MEQHAAEGEMIHVPVGLGTVSCRMSDGMYDGDDDGVYAFERRRSISHIIQQIYTHAEF